MYTDANDLALLANFATILGIPIAILALVYAALQLSKSARIAKGQFLVQIEDQRWKSDSKTRGIRPVFRDTLLLERAQNPAPASIDKQLSISIRPLSLSTSRVIQDSG